MVKFDSEMEKLKATDEMAYKWLLERTESHHWSRAHFRTGSDCDVLINNLCESFNSTILDAREQPILGMLEKIRIYLMMRLQTKRDWMAKQEVVVCPKVQKKLDKLVDRAAACIARLSGENKFEVRHMFGERFAVDLEKRTCDCRKWELTGLPCEHVISASGWTKYSPEHWVDDCYKKPAYMKAYGPVLCPLNGPNAWESSDKQPIYPPKKLKLVGRPKRVRRREPDEVRTTSSGVTRLVRTGITCMTCNYCHGKGHNLRTCPRRVSMAGVQVDNDSGQPLNSNKCGLCHTFEHNKRTCPLKESQQNDASTEGVAISAHFRPQHQSTPGTCSSTQNVHTTEQHRTVPTAHPQHQSTPGTCSSTQNVHATEQHRTVSTAHQQVEQEIGTQKSVAMATANANATSALPSATDISNANATTNATTNRKCCFCKQRWHNRQTCPSTVAQNWRKRKAARFVP